jgi:hypothetical protein
MLQYSRELNNRGLINPANGLLPPSVASPITLEANPLQRYITGQDVIADYQLQNTDNERVMLAKIDRRNNEEKLLDSSNINPAKLDQDVVEQMLYEDRQNQGQNYMGLDATDFIREADTSTERFEQFKNSLALIEGGQDAVLKSVREMTVALSNREKIRNEVADLVERVKQENEETNEETQETDDMEDGIENVVRNLPGIVDFYGINRRRGLYGV